MNIFLKIGDSVPRDDCISEIVQLGDFVYLSGQTGRGTTFHEQCVTACYRVIDVLKDLDLRIDHIVKFTVYLTDISLKDQFISVFKNFVEAPYPAMTIVEVSALENDAMIEIEGIGVNTLRHEKSMQSSNCSDCDDQPTH
ncbi:RidA family protein [Dubosiella newyorkensis]|jgi:2-iminobutanoate/2-iminopropanoate deaminase|uniref:Translation initiation inhibitor, yjgF family protein n=2 Tax=Dubosiella newyorkensis TaxID=1862672 RepID=A0A1U7NLL9_9FIRM|nr:RidA family protein [Dubosiella newyorkensis]MCI9041237.1 RidA family protein [Dubosiella newyorkensis]OLU45685.1 translation initiation inhibitor, yjgF family protein [Dubosiella newyorkensis]